MTKQTIIYNLSKLADQLEYDVYEPDDQDVTLLWQAIEKLKVCTCPERK